MKSKILNIINSIFKWVGYILIIPAALGLILKFINLGNKGFFLFLKNNYLIIWLFTITILLLSIIFSKKRYGFKDNFNKDLSNNWDYNGPWRIMDNNTLIITGSDKGGITKKGAFWENYTLKFKAKIVNECLGVIVRAQDINNYYMFQIGTSRIRPHRRIAVPKIIKEEGSNENFVTYQVGWQIFEPPIELQTKLVDWFDVKIRVYGQAVYIYINNDLVLQRESFLNIRFGKIGFRNWGTEEAWVQKVKVHIDD